MADTNDEKSKSGFKVTDRRGTERSEPTPQPEAKAEKPRVPRPPLDFTTFILSLASTAMIQMGVAPNPETNETNADPELARETIDLLGMLREKTRGNLTDEEAKFFDAMLYDLRVRFVELTTKNRS